ncbi:L,D-transpeptidase [Pseudonocardia kunmingensis]|uniref:L,D-transpeptidase-like protein n=1 Tax=Pseudonocardia kunmingensis TaxID=630975 RepID=A0A543DAE9_9PSEU|nr:L,D-transpeptidase [Pseudonocardia kunmingensis]TQM06300.1 L,D-transpeptidase-like protein [Pseudonocardia kunmingensis]
MSQHSAPPEAAPSRGSAPGPSRRGLLYGAIAGAVVIFAVVLGFTFFGGGGESGTDPSSVAAGEGAAPGELPVSSTYTTVEGAPADADPTGRTDGLVVHPVRETPVHDAPDGRAIARMETTQFGDTWLPVLAEQPGWVQVLLPSRPASSTGWIRADDVERARTPYVIEVHLGSKTLELVRDGDVVDQWSVGIGKPDTPTPTGRTFLLGAFADENQNYSPVILPLGTHSPTHDTYGGGPGTVAIHTWPSADVFGAAISDGCIRVPQDALDQLAEVPLGTLVIIDQD